jgi:hypothetical protein
MKNAQDKYVITDVNLRTAGGMSMACAAGWDEISALANIMLGAPEQTISKCVPQNIPETFVMRAYTDIITHREK